MALSSTYRYKNTDKSLSQIASELGVDGVVEGSVQRAGGRVRVNAQLVYAPKETHLWAQSYDRDFLDALAVQSAIAGMIAKRYGAEIGGLFLAFPAIFPASASLIEKQALVMTYSDCFWLLGILLVAITPIVLLLRSPKPGAPLAAGH